MQENEFEKRVREIMDEFKITPSGSVWDKVEQQIPKQKRRRRWMILFFLLAGLTVSGYFIYYNYNNVTTTANTTVNNKENQTKNDSNSISLSNEYASNIKPYPNENKIQQDQSNQKIREEKSNAAIDKKVYNNNLSNFAKDEPSSKTVDKNEDSAAANQTEELTKQEAPVKQETEKIIGSDTTIKNATTLNSADEQQENGSNKQLLKDSSQTLVTVDSRNKESSKKNVHKKWQFGVTAFYGRSDVFENLLGIQVNTVPVPASYYADQNGVTGFQRTPVTYSRDIKARAAFSIGVATKRYLTSKSNLNIGLQYSKFQTEIQTGPMQDSSAVFRYNNLNAAPSTNLIGYYKPGTENAHKNAYSFIQIPVLYEHSLLKNKLLWWNAGASVARLISSNALVYDNYNNVYYNNNDLLRKTQITLLAGVNARFHLGTTAINLGPQFQYGLTNLFRHNDYGSQHLFTWGLQANIFFRK
jgi:hypothetical protein